MMNFNIMDLKKQYEEEVCKQLGEIYRDVVIQMVLEIHGNTSRSANSDGLATPLPQNAKKELNVEHLEKALMTEKQYATIRSKRLQYWYAMKKATDSSVRLGYQVLYENATKELAVVGEV
jgi:hypothetical protein